MAPYTASTTTTRVGRVTHWLFPSRRTVVATAAVEVAAFVVGFPLLVHVIAGLLAHLVRTLVRWVR